MIIEAVTLFYEMRVRPINYIGKRYTVSIAGSQPRFSQRTAPIHGTFANCRFGGAVPIFGIVTTCVLPLQEWFLSE